MEYHDYHSSSSFQMTPEVQPNIFSFSPFLTIWRPNPADTEAEMFSVAELYLED